MIVYKITPDGKKELKNPNSVYKVKPKLRKRIEDAIRKILEEK